MDRLWAPWRMAYILAGDETADECIFCAFVAKGPTLFRGSWVTAYEVPPSAMNTAAVAMTLA